MVAASPCALAVAPLAYATAISSLASKVLSESFNVLSFIDRLFSSVGISSAFFDL